MKTPQEIESQAIERTFKVALALVALGIPTKHFMEQSIEQTRHDQIVQNIRVEDFSEAQRIQLCTAGSIYRIFRKERFCPPESTAGYTPTPEFTAGYPTSQQREIGHIKVEDFSEAQRAQLCTILEIRNTFEGYIFTRPLFSKGQYFCPKTQDIHGDDDDE